MVYSSSTYKHIYVLVKIMKEFSFVNVSLFPVLLWCFGVMNKLKLHVWTILVSFIYINKYRSWIKSRVHNNNADVFG